MMKHVCLPTIFLACCLGTASAQIGKLEGQVTNIKGDPIPYATISVKGSTTAVSADQNGYFQISTPVKSSLIVTATGYEQKDITLTNENFLTITLTDDNALGEVVVTALGISKKSAALGYAIQQISGTEITKARETNIVNSLAGKIAGVRVTSQSGTLGGASRIIIRGVSSLSGNNNEPLFVVDGFPIDNGSRNISTNSGAAPSGVGSVDFGNRASDIDPDNVESISILKGAAATALYGSRAKNGAVLITTKHGTKGKTSVTFNSSTRFDNVLKLPELQNEYAQGSGGVFNRAALNGWGPRIADIQDQTFPDFKGDPVKLEAYPNNIKDFYKTGNTYINSLGIDGGNESTDYRLSYSNTMQNGILSNQSFLRNSLSLNVDKTISEQLSVRVNMNYAGTTSRGRPVQSSNDGSLTFFYLAALPRTLDMKKLQENYYDSALGTQRTLTPSRSGNNPYWLINNNSYNSSVDRVFGNAVVSYKPLKWLTLSNNLGLDFYNEFRNGHTRKGTIGALTGNFLEANLYSRIVNNDLVATVNTNIAPGLNLKALLGNNINDRTFRRSQSYAQDLTIDQLYSFSNAASVTSSNYFEQQRIVGLYGELGFNYHDYLFLDITGRNDWSSILPLANRSYFYPSVNASFVFTHFVKPAWLSYGKVRVAYANVGSDDNPYLTEYTYAPQTNVSAAYNYGVNFPFNGALAYSIPITIPSSNLKPQQQSSFEAGTELAFLKNRIRVDFTYYNSLTKDQIVALAVPNSSGYRSIRTNAGTLKNSGIELQLGLTPLHTRDFVWNIEANLSHNKQVVSELPAGITNTYTLATGWQSLQIRAERGKELGIYGVGWNRDPQGEIIIDPNSGLRTTKSDVRLGNLYPDYLIGINNSFTFQRFNLSFLIDIRRGGVMYSSTASVLRTAGLAIETLAGRDREFIDKGVVAADDGNFISNTKPVSSMEQFWSENFKTGNTEANIFDASYAKLRELRLSYNLSPSVFGKASGFFKALEVAVEARNCWLIHSSVPHVDPEVNFFTNNPIGEAVEFSSMPSARTLGFNIRAKF